MTLIQSILSVCDMHHLIAGINSLIQFVNLIPVM